MSGRGLPREGVRGNFDEEVRMNPNKAGHVNEGITSGEKTCAHQRMVDEHYNEQGKKTGFLVCRECGAVIQNSVNT